MAQIPVDLRLYSEVRTLVHGNYPEYDNWPPKNHSDLVFPGIVLGDAHLATCPKSLKALGVTHVLNASMGSKFNMTNTNQAYYDEFKMTFHGIPAIDVMGFKLTPYFRPAADFIEQAIKSEGIVYVHCQQGVSRSASIVLAFLMLKRNMRLMDALKLVKGKRAIYPNDGFLKQLCNFDVELFEPDKLETAASVSEGKN